MAFVVSGRVRVGSPSDQDDEAIDDDPDGDHDQNCRTAHDLSSGQVQPVRPHDVGSHEQRDGDQELRDADEVRQLVQVHPPAPSTRISTLEPTRASTSTTPVASRSSP